MRGNRSQRGWILQNNKGEVVMTFSGPIGLKETNEREILLVKMIIEDFKGRYSEQLIIKGDSENTIKWVAKKGGKTWISEFIVGELER